MPYGKLEDILSRESAALNCHTNDDRRAWFAIDLGKTFLFFELVSLHCEATVDPPSQIDLSCFHFTKFSHIFIIFDLGQWDILLLNLTSIGFTNFCRCLIIDLSFFTIADVVTIEDETSKKIRETDAGSIDFHCFHDFF